MGLILGIETSCDDTAMAVVENGRRVLGSFLASQVGLHNKFGGVVPELAAREHLSNITPLFEYLVDTLGIDPKKDIDGIAVTRGPGLVGALLVGVSFAKGLASALGKPLIPVDHIYAHIHGGFLGVSFKGNQLRSFKVNQLRSFPLDPSLLSCENEKGNQLRSFPLGPSLPLDGNGLPLDPSLPSDGNGLPLDPSLFLEELLPCLALVVSGGHTNLYKVLSPTSFELLATSMDDSCGECFDKVAKLCGLPYPGGPIIEKIARAGDPKKFPMPRMLPSKSQLAFSYSGLKTHMFYLKKNNPERFAHEAELADILAAFQDEAFGQIIRKLKIALQTYGSSSKSLVIAGGVAANQRLRALVEQELDIPAYFPELKYCTDNAAMVAAYGWHKFCAEPDKKIFEQFDWDVYSSHYMVEK